MNSITEISKIIGKDKDQTHYDGTYTMMNDENLLDAFRGYIECTKESGFRINFKITKLEWQEMSDDERKIWKEDTERESYRNRLKVSSALMALQEIKVRGLMETKQVYEYMDYLKRVGT